MSKIWWSYFVVMLVVTLTLLFIEAPAWLATTLLPRYQTEVTLTSARGTLWQGNADLHSKTNLYLGKLGWKLDAASLLRREKKLEFKLQRLDQAQAQSYLIEGRLSLTPDQLSATDINANLNAEAIAALLINQTYFEAKEPVSLSEGIIEWSLTDDMAWHAPTSMSAQLAWPGGDVVITFDSWRLTQQIPPLAGQLENDEHGLHLGITETLEKLPLITVTLDRAGMLTIQTLQGLLHALGRPVSTDDQPEEVLTTQTWDLAEYL